jgi:HrpA-like RNA helicase
MSASIDAQRFCEYFGSCPNMNCPGRNYPVEEIYLPLPEDSTTKHELVAHATNVLFERIVSGAEEVPGDVLIFLSGASDIDACVSEINARADKNGDNVVAYPLYAKLDEGSRAAATNPSHRGGLGSKAKPGSKERRKVICTTNVRNP